ncbi:unnamed protein product, partial [Timema podura]|nr:unnamed protein product [Timema podura]
MSKQTISTVVRGMVELQSGASSFNVPNLGFGYLEDEDDTSIEEMAQHCDKLQVLKESLKTQQVMLRNAVNSLSKATIEIASITTGGATSPSNQIIHQARSSSQSLLDLRVTLGQIFRRSSI